MTTTFTPEMRKALEEAGGSHWRSLTLKLSNGTSS